MLIGWVCRNNIEPWLNIFFFLDSIHRLWNLWNFHVRFGRAGRKFAGHVRGHVKQEYCDAKFDLNAYLKFLLIHLSPLLNAYMDRRSNVCECVRNRLVPALWVWLLCFNVNGRAREEYWDAKFGLNGYLKFYFSIISSPLLDICMVRQGVQWYWL
jgi:hypothetical protein